MPVIQDQLCRACLKSDLFVGIDLGILPISNELLSESQLNIEEFPLTLVICKHCALGQVTDAVLPERLFSDYRYLSSVSSTFLEHARIFSERLLQEEILGKGDFVIEIACNDGYLLKNFLNSDLRVLGIEPAANVSKRAAELGIPVINEFFGSELAREIVKEHGYPKVIIANNVLAHVPDIRDFMEGLSILCGPSTQISIENPSILNILESNQFDTIYHEHYSYLSCHAVQKLSGIFGLNLFHVELLTTHGGSNRYWLSRETKLMSPELKIQIKRELDSGLLSEASWAKARKKVIHTLSELRDWLITKHESGELVVGYGAAAKASTLLNSAKVEKLYLTSICDLGAEKVGRYMPRENYEVISLPKMIALHPQHILIFPWNISEEITKQLEGEIKNTSFWLAVPDLKRIK